MADNPLHDHFYLILLVNTTRLVQLNNDENLIKIINKTT